MLLFSWCSRGGGCVATASRLLFGGFWKAICSVGMTGLFYARDLRLLINHTAVLRRVPNPASVFFYSLHGSLTPRSSVNYRFSVPDSGSLYAAIGGGVLCGTGYRGSCWTLGSGWRLDSSVLSRNASAGTSASGMNFCFNAVCLVLWRPFPLYGLVAVLFRVFSWASATTE